MLKKTISGILLGLLLLGCQQERQQKIHEARLLFRIGDVLVNGQPAKLGQILNNHDVINTGEESTAEVFLGPQTGAQIRSNSLVVLVIEKDGWKLDTKRGAILSLVQRGKHYRIKSPSAVAAVRGTIFYTHTYEDGSEYICTCNGDVDIIFDGNTKSVYASHHEGYTVLQSDSVKNIQTAGMKEHTDLEIFDFMYRLDQAQGKNLK